MKENLSNLPSVQEADQAGPGPLQQGLTRRKGTISIIAEYKRTFIVETGFANEVFEPHLMSPVFREFGARGIAVLADKRMGGCDYDDMAKIVEEQQGAMGDVPGPVPVISSDLIVDEVQIARSAAVGAQGVLLSYGVVGDKLELFLKCARAVGMEAIVAVSTKEEAQRAIDVGARMISVTGVDEVDEKLAVITDLVIPEGAQVCTIANILANDNKALEEVEEAWVCRDKGFHCVWVSDCLYKSGNDPAEHAGAIIRSMGAKSSVKWASAKAMGGKGEGAREYLGDILM
jgi:indole-3-glycerol phosphate synthase